MATDMDSGLRRNGAVGGAGELVEYAMLSKVPAWLERGLARPAVQRGLDIPRRDTL